MVKLHLKNSCKDVLIEDIIATGQLPFFTDLSKVFPEFNTQLNIDRVRMIYNGRVLSDEDLKKITDKDSLRVIVLPESKLKRPIDEAHKKNIQAELQTIAAPYKNPEDRRLHGFNHDFSLPNHMTKILKDHPNLVFDNQFLCVLGDWYLFRAYCIRNTFKKDPARGLFKYTNPEFLQIVKEILTTIGSRYGFHMPGHQVPPAQRPGSGEGVITQAFLQNALQAALAGVGMPPAARAPAPAPAPVQAQPAPQPEEPMQQGFEQQAATLREFGFENDELIQLALEQSNGDVQAAMEFLIELQN